MTVYFNQDEAQTAEQVFKKNGIIRQDAGIWFAQQLEAVRNRVYESPKFQSKLAGIIPRSSDIGKWAETFSYKVYSEAGLAKVVANYADDIPTVEVGGTEVIGKIVPIALSYIYNVQEVAISEATGQSLPARKAIAMRNGIERKIDNLTLVGDADYGITGATNNANIGTTTLPNTAAWSTLTAEQILANLNAIYNAIMLQSNGYHRATHIVMPLSAYTQAASKYLSATGKSAMATFKEDHSDVEVIEAVEMDASKTIFAGEFSIMNIESIVPQPIEILPVQAENLSFKVIGHARSGGTAVYLPLAFTKAVLA